MRALLSKFIVTLIVTLLSPTIVWGQPKLARESIPPGTPKDVRTAIEDLYDSGAVARFDAEAALAKLGGHARAAIPYLIELLDDAAPVVRAPELTQLPAEQHTTVADGAIDALAKIGGAAIAPLVAALKTERARGAAAALARIGRKSLKPLQTALKDPDARVRAAAAEALGLLADPSARKSLERATKDSDESVRAKAADALSRLHEKP